MDGQQVLSHVEQLDDSIDDLEEALEPLLNTAFSDATSKLPVLDRAKLYVTVTYTIESLLFSYLRLNGVQAKDHPVFQELTRVKQYFEKIKLAEFGPEKRENMSLNKPAAGRLIKHALAGNKKYDLERAEIQAKEKAQAKVKLQQLERNMAGGDGSIAAKGQVEDTSSSEDKSSIEPETQTQQSAPATTEVTYKRSKKQKKSHKPKKKSTPLLQYDGGDDSQSSGRIYLGNLPYSATDADIRDLLKGYEITTITIPENPRTRRPTGYAFADLKAADDAERIVAALNEKIYLAGRKLTIVKANPRFDVKDA